MNNFFSQWNDELIKYFNFLLKNLKVHLTQMHSTDHLMCKAVIDIQLTHHATMHAYYRYIHQKERKLITLFHYIWFDLIEMHDVMWWRYIFYWWVCQDVCFQLSSSHLLRCYLYFTVFWNVNRMCFESRECSLELKD